MTSARPRSRYWSDLTSEEFSRLDRSRLIAVLPVGATEQHGPHLPMSTDTATIDGMVRATISTCQTICPFFPAHGGYSRAAALPLSRHAHGVAST
jgi:creatinine amidohydrolase/Fe(II)-dependent formamide hydrolase-like protein